MLLWWADENKGKAESNRHGFAGIVTADDA
jgi:hypothetical protein